VTARFKAAILRERRIGLHSVGADMSNRGWICVAAVLLWMVPIQANATVVFSINLFGPAPTGVTQIGIPQAVHQMPEGGFAGYNGFQSAQYIFSSNGIADFGSVTFYPLFTPCIRDCFKGFGEDVSLGSYSLGFLGTTNDKNAASGQYTASGTLLDICSTDFPCSTPTTTRTVALTFNVTSGENLLLYWQNPASYSPAMGSSASFVPEPSTWAMLLTGFAGIGLMTYRRRKSAMLAA
jgi:hypothetical protein